MTFWLIVIAIVILIEVGHWLVGRLKAEGTPEKRKVSERRMKRLWVVDPSLNDRVKVVPRSTDERLRRLIEGVTIYDEGRDDE